MTMFERHKLIEIQVAKNKRTGLLIATSDDLRGLFVHGSTMDELNERIPVAIMAIMDAKGHKNVSVRPTEQVSLENIGFESQTRKFELQDAA